MLKVKIQLEDNGKKAEIELSETDNLQKLMIIQNVFNLFGIESDILEMTKTYSKIGSAYSQFFNQVNPIEPPQKKDIESNKEEFKKQFEQSFTENKNEIETTYKEVNDQPEFVRTGIKEKDGVKRYRLHYKCYACYNTGTHYIYKESKTTWCHRCQHVLKVEEATPNGFPEQDTFGNFFIAGDYHDWNTWDGQ